LGFAGLLAFKQVHGLFVGLWVLGFDGPWAMDKWMCLGLSSIVGN